MLPKNHRITDGAEFKRVMRRGRRKNINGIAVFILPRADNINRYGFIITNKFGNAVARNKLKRQLREVTHQKLTSEAGKDVVFLVTKLDATPTWDELESSITRVI